MSKELATEAIVRLFGSSRSVRAGELALVKKVDKTLNTIDAELLSLSGLTEQGIRLQATEGEKYGWVIYPKIETLVLLCKIDATEWYVLTVLEPESLALKIGQDFTQTISEAGDLVFNDGGLGGLVKAQELKTQIDKNTAILQQIVSVLTGVFIPEPGNGAPSALQQALSAVVVGKPFANLANIENPKIKH